MFRTSPEAEAGHGQVMEQTHTPGTKKGVGQNRVDSDPVTAEKSDGKSQWFHCSGSMVEDPCKFANILSSEVWTAEVSTWEETWIAEGGGKGM